MSDTAKIGISCAIGASLMFVVAVVLSPDIWWLGLLSGFAGGYISFRFRDVLSATLVAIQKANSKTYDVLSNVFGSIYKFLRKPHPFAYYGLMITIPVSYFLFIFLLSTLHATPTLNQILMLYLTTMIGALEIFLFNSLLIYYLTRLGANSKKMYFTPLGDIGRPEKNKARVAKWKGLGYTKERATYLNTLRWSLRGMGVILLFLILTMWVKLIIAIGMMFYFLGKVLWHLFKIIHSKERIVCGINGTLGGFSAYVYWRFYSTQTIKEFLLILISGVILGIALGILSYEIFSKRVLKLVPLKTSEQ